MLYRKKKIAEKCPKMEKKWPKNKPETKRDKITFYRLHRVFRTKNGRKMALNSRRNGMKNGAENGALKTKKK